MCLGSNNRIVLYSTIKNIINFIIILIIESKILYKKNEEDALEDVVDCCYFNGRRDCEHLSVYYYLTPANRVRSITLF